MIVPLLYACSLAFLLGILFVIVVVPWTRYIRRPRLREALRHQYGLSADFSLIAFFHPYCTSRGGGERVLWAAIKSMELIKGKPAILVIYTSDSNCIKNRAQVLREVRQTFGVQLDAKASIHFVLLRGTLLLSPQLYPVLTLAGQALGSVLVCLEALIRCPPDIFIDTTGFAFILPLAKRLFGAKTAAYVHYPTVSSDMIDRVSAGLHRSENDLAGETYNNASWIRNSAFMTRIKLLYYRSLIGAYRWVGSPSNTDCVMTNSTWTRNHILSLWNGDPSIVYPPCPTEDLASGDSDERQPWIMSVGQFRPEKNHELQIEAFLQFLTRNALGTRADGHPYRLLLIGGCRDATDFARVDQLRQLVRTRDLENVVQFHINVSYSHLKRYFHQCMINLHTMVDEHFGIGIVEGMAAGLITIAHNSGGPKSDIIGPARASCSDQDQNVSIEPVSVGFLARTVEEYALTFEHVMMRMSDAQKDAMRKHARLWVQKKFSELCFSKSWLNNMQDLGL
ncbi:GDP-Man:Man(3)GlcNAc(2)-PP-Dol alpha-1 2-mannosyltransferase [Fasciola hepatica]|uniref:GDP-Man:Man(3)GlcNAc(2)-PP-Dol alpha-1,2-mannosyltransferase n=1 Tax=Fasciola hepatica TaxID=6192 RepID=A0A2H1C105_FASHE|nr:GDP-Man:Man(3)GlcNAc(2)-PP-Dol alpha-1 2-mannosyltransferase [Fasciola hepatica]